MPSREDLVSRALVRLGAEPITSLDDGTTAAIVATNLYPSVIADLMARRRWNFLSGQLQLSRLADAPAQRWDAAYQLPAGLMNITAVLIDDHSIPFERMDNKVFCNATTSDAVYVQYSAETDIERWPAWFCTLVELELASVLAIPVGDRSDLAEWYEQKSGRHFNLCKQLDGQGTHAKKLPVGRIRASRLGRGRGGLNA